MAEKITARIDQIRNNIQLLANDAKKAANETAQINTKLKFDTSNVSLVVERFEALQKELETNTQKLEGLRKAQQELNEERAKEKGDTEESKKRLSEIEKLAAQYARDIEKAEINQSRLNQLLNQTYKNSQIIRTATQQINDKYEVWLQASEKLAVATKQVYNILKNVVSEASETGIQLSSLAKRYNTTAEDIQTWDRALQLATGQSQLFTQSLSVMVKGMAQIAAGRGVAFTKALKNIGIAYKDIKDLSATEQFETIIEGLSSVENYSTRAAAAQQLFGESGQYIASVLNDGGQALDGYIEKAAGFGIIANSDAEALAQMNIALEKANSQFTEAKAQLALALAPALEVITGLIRDVLAPAIRRLSDIFKSMGKVGQSAIIILGVLLLLIPKIIKGIIAWRISLLSLQAGATKAAVAVNLLKTTMLGMGAIVGIIGLVGILVGSLSQLGNKAEETKDSLEEMAEVGESMGVYGTQAQANTESTATTLTTKTVDISVEITGKGDTDISDEAAVTVAQLTADQVNRVLGELTKE